MNFKTLSVARHPVQDMWHSFRDRLEEVGDQVEDLAYIRLIDRATVADGRLRTVYEWRAAPQLPTLVQPYVNEDMLTWTDTAVWDEATYCCHWQTDSYYFHDNMTCSGTTTFVPAMGGRGSRITFEGRIHWAGGPGTVAGLTSGPVANAIERVLSKMIPKNFHHIAQASEILLLQP